MTTHAPVAAPLPPHNLEAEQALLGALLTNRDAILTTADSLLPCAFYLAKHQQIYGAVLACYARQTPPDVLTVSEELRRRGQLDGVGGLAYLASLDAPHGGYHVGYYADIVRRTATRRDAIAAGGRIAALGYDEAGDLDVQIADMHALLTGATQGGTPSNLHAVGDALDTWYPTLMDTDARPGVSTGLRDLDLLTGGLWPTDLVVLAARPGLGKSALALTIADHVTAGDGSVLVFSLEMSREQLLQRLIAMHTGVDMLRLRSRQVRKDELPRIADAINTLHGRPLWIDDTAARSVQQIRAQAQRYVAQHGALALLIVDYLGLMQASSRYAGQRVNEVGEISRGLKQLAKEVACPVLALHQLNRAVEGRTSHVPLLSDLRDSGAVEQDADTVMFIHREEIYDQNSDKKGIADIHIAKQRQGPLGVIPLRFDAPTTRFSTLTYREPQGYQ